MKNYTKVCQNASMNKVRYLPFVLVEPRIDTFFDFLSFKCNDVTSFLARHAESLFIGWILSSLQLFPLYRLQHDGVFARNFWEQPAACQISVRISHINFKLDLLVDDDCDYSGVRISPNRLEREMILYSRGLSFLVQRILDLRVSH